MPYLWGITLLMYVFFIALWCCFVCCCGPGVRKNDASFYSVFVGSSLSATVKIVIFALGRMLPGKERFFFALMKNVLLLTN